MRFNLGTATLTSLLVVSGTAFAGKVNLENGVAIKGYDPVAHFTDHKPVKGVPEYTADYDGATYEFVSAAHRVLFWRRLKNTCRSSGAFAPNSPLTKSALV
jgi:hypothetical protein